MTKLFSVKSLAFAGAAAFALTLAAAPQADAAETAGIAIEKYSYGDARLCASTSAINVVDGKAEYFYSVVASGKSAPTKNYKSANAVVDEIDKDNKNVYFSVPGGELTKGKAKDLYIAGNSTGDVKTEALTYQKAPTIKAKVITTATGPSITLKINGKDADANTNGYIEVASLYGGLSTKIDISDLYGTTTSAIAAKSDFSTELQSMVDLGGGSVQITYKQYDYDFGYSDEFEQKKGESDADYMKRLLTPSSKAVKVKIAGQAAAPKNSLKLALNKALSFKLKSTQEFRVYSADASDEGLTWTTAATSAYTALDTLFGDKYTTKDASGEYTLNENMKFQLRTAANDAKGKPASKITTTTIYGSTTTPAAITNVKVENKAVTKKNVTTTSASITFDTKDLELMQVSSASNSGITAKVVLQYKSDKDTKWKDAKTTPVVYTNANIPDVIYVRVKGTNAAATAKAKSYLEAPGKVLTIKLDKQDPENASTYNYDGTAVTKGAINTK